MTWINVKDKLPELGQRVIALNIKNEKPLICEYDYFRNRKEFVFVYNDLIFCFENVTHWMTFPDYPKDK